MTINPNLAISMLPTLLMRIIINMYKCPATLSRLQPPPPSPDIILRRHKPAWRPRNPAYIEQGATAAVVPAPTRNKSPPRGSRVCGDRVSTQMLDLTTPRSLHRARHIGIPPPASLNRPSSSIPHLLSILASAGDLTLMVSLQGQIPP